MEEKWKKGEKLQKQASNVHDRNRKKLQKKKQFKKSRSCRNQPSKQRKSKIGQRQKKQIVESVTERITMSATSYDSSSRNIETKLTNFNKTANVSLLSSGPGPISRSFWEMSTAFKEVIPAWVPHGVANAPRLLQAFHIISECNALKSHSALLSYEWAEAIYELNRWSCGSTQYADL